MRFSKSIELDRLSFVYSFFVIYPTQLNKIYYEHIHPTTTTSTKNLIGHDTSIISFFCCLQLPFLLPPSLCLCLCLSGIFTFNKKTQLSCTPNECKFETHRIEEKINTNNNDSGNTGISMRKFQIQKHKHWHSHMHIDLLKNFAFLLQFIKFDRTTPTTNPMAIEKNWCEMFVSWWISMEYVYYLLRTK